MMRFCGNANWRWGVVVPLALGAILLFQSKIPAAENAGTNGAAANPTFTKDVAPILQRACQNCHHPGAIAPMSLLTYAEARPWARSIKEKVVRRQMPPWYIDRRVGIQEFKEDPSLSDTEIATIARWADTGTPEGARADMPPPVKFEEMGKWHIGKPDLIVTLPEPHKVKAEEPDNWLDLYSDSGLTEDRYIKAVEGMPSIPDGFRVVHHAHQYLIPPGTEQSCPPDSVGCFAGREETLNEYSVGKNGDIFPEGAGRLMKAGSKVHFNMHYHAVGQEIVDNFKVGIVFYPKGEAPKHVMRSLQLVLQQTAETLDIPAGAKDVRTDSFHRFNTPVVLTGFQPHMHDRGKRECIEVLYPDDRRETLNCADFNFGWAIAYDYADDAMPLLPAGTVLHIINWHDNSTANRANPDPRNWVGYGARTIDDMSFSWIFWYDMTNDEYKQAVEARRAHRMTAAKQPPQLKIAIHP